MIPGDTTAITGTLQIKGLESDASGEQTRVFERVTDPALLDACRKAG